MTVALFEDDPGEWDEFVRACPGGTFFHQHDWLSLVERVYGAVPFYLAAYESGGIAGVLPLALRRVMGYGRILVSVPFSDEGGLCTRTSAAEAALLAEAERLGEETRAHHVEIRQLGWTPGRDLPCDRTRVVLRMPLPRCAEELWDSLSSNMRKKVRRSMRDGLTAHESDGRDVATFYEVYAHNNRDLGSPMHSRRFFEAVFSLFPDASMTVLVKLQETVVGAAVAVWFGNVFTVMCAHSLRQHHSLFPSNLLYWRLFESAIERGCSTADFGRSPKDSGIYAFKKSWGMEDHQLTYAGIPVKGAPLVGERRAGLGYRAFAAVWRRVPVSVAKTVGPWIWARIPI